MGGKSSSGDGGIQGQSTTHNEQIQQSEKSQEPSSPDWIVIFTGAVACAAIAQVVAMIYTYLEIKKQAGLTDETLKEVKRQAQAATDDLIYGNRAYLQISITNWSGLFTRPMTVECILKNVGRTPAHVFETGARLFSEEGFPVFHVESKFMNFPIMPGEERMEELVDRSTTSYQGAQAIIPDGGGLFFFAVVKYRDEFKIERATQLALCRGKASTTWQPIARDGYNSAD